MGAWMVSKIPSLSPRASGFSLRPWAVGGIFDTTLAPIWYFYSIFLMRHSDMAHFKTILEIFTLRYGNLLQYKNQHFPVKSAFYLLKKLQKS